MNQQEQKHPQERRDRDIVQDLLQAPVPTELHLVELARLRIRYQGFPGAREIQLHLDQLLQKWQISEAELFDKTRAIHAQGKVYRRSQLTDTDDWN